MDDLALAYDRFGPSLYRHALAVARRAADAEDAVHAAFARLLARGGVSEVRDLGAYLHVAVRREALRAASRALPGLADDDLVVARPGRSAEDADRLNQALAKLPAEQREVVVLHVLEGLTFERIGELTEVSANTAASRWRYAREKLKEWLDDEA